MNNIVLHINGGIGKSIIATMVIASYKKTYPESKIVIITGHPEVFFNNPNVYRVYQHNTPYLWKDYYGNNEWKVSADEPYFTESWIKDKPVHLSQIWCELLGVKCCTDTPELYFSGAEVEELQATINVDKPLLVVQSTGGSNASMRSWTRNPPTNELDEFLGTFIQSHYILHLCLENTPVLKNVSQRITNMSIRQALCLIYYCENFVGIDSFGLHTRAANKNTRQGIFFFPLETNVKRLGYNHFTNLIPTKEINEKIKEHSDYWGNILKFNIENYSYNSPIEPGVKWFNINEIK